LYDVVLMCIVEGFSDLADDMKRPSGSHRPRLQGCVGVSAVDELHGNPRQPVVGLATPINGHNVGMVARQRRTADGAFLGLDLFD
jgi:hypothetical protein